MAGPRLYVTFVRRDLDLVRAVGRSVGQGDHRHWSRELLFQVVGDNPFTQSGAPTLRLFGRRV